MHPETPGTLYLRFNAVLHQVIFIHQITAITSCLNPASRLLGLDANPHPIILGNGSLANVPACPVPIGTSLSAAATVAAFEALVPPAQNGEQLRVKPLIPPALND
jgi:hypothetical protein